MLVVLALLHNVMFRNNNNYSEIVIIIIIDSLRMLMLVYI